LRGVRKGDERERGKGERREGRGGGTIYMSSRGMKVEYNEKK